MRCLRRALVARSRACPHRAAIMDCTDSVNACSCQPRSPLSLGSEGAVATGQALVEEAAKRAKVASACAMMTCRSAAAAIRAFFFLRVSFAAAP
jgi:hypothetical protein